MNTQPREEWFTGTVSNHVDEVAGLRREAAACADKLLIILKQIEQLDGCLPVEGFREPVSFTMEGGATVNVRRDPIFLDMENALHVAETLARGSTEGCERVDVENAERIAWEQAQ